MFAKLFAAYVLLGYDYLCTFNMPFVLCSGAVVAFVIARGVRYGTMGHNNWKRP